MPETNAQSVAESLYTALETMAFISPLPWEGEMPPAPADLVVASVRCRGARNCVLEVMADGAFGAAVAANLADPGVSEPVCETRADDAVKELINITAGLVMRGLATHGAGVLALDVPTVEHGLPGERWAEFVGDSEACVFDADGVAIAVRLRSID